MDLLLLSLFLFPAFPQKGFGLSPSGIPLVQSRESGGETWPSGLSGRSDLRSGWSPRGGGFYHSCLQLCSYNSPLHFGLGTRLTVTGMGAPLLMGVPVVGHDSQLLGGELGVRMGVKAALPSRSSYSSGPCSVSGFCVFSLFFLLFSRTPLISAFLMCVLFYVSFLVRSSPFFPPILTQSCTVDSMLVNSSVFYVKIPPNTYRQLRTLSSPSLSSFSVSNVSKV